MLLTEFIGEKYEAIDRTEKKAFWIVFLFGFILYSFYIFNFLIGDHSILSILKPMEEALASGRFSGLLINRLTLSLYLPVLSPLINIFSLSFFSVAIVHLFSTNKQLYVYLFVGFFVLSMPYVINWFYFTIYMYVYFFLIAIGFLSLRKNIIFNNLGAVLCFFLALGAYQPTINVIAILFIFSIIFDLTNHENQKKLLFKDFFQKYLRYFLVIFIAFLCYCAVYLLMKKMNMIGDSYMTSLSSPFDIIKKIPAVFISSLRQILIPQPFLGLVYKIILILFFIIFLIFSYEKILKKYQYEHEKIFAFILFLILTVFAIFCMNLTDLLTEFTLADVNRQMVFGYLVFFSIVVVFVFSYANDLVNNFFSILSIVIIIFSSIGNLYIQRNWKINNEIEREQVCRVIAEIENIEGFNYSNSYAIYEVGTIQKYKDSNVSKLFYHNEKKANYSPLKLLIWNLIFGSGFDFPYTFYPLNTLTVDTGWMPHMVYTFYEPRFNLTLLDINNMNNELRGEFVNALRSANVWPARSSVQIINDDTILLFFDENELELLKSDFGIE